jgi:CheY-like chemotaxis protein
MSADWHPTGLILIVDDETLVREVMREIVEAIGFEAIEASNGREALVLCRTHSARITAVLLDLTMPEMDGIHTLRELRQLHPVLPVLLISGYTEQEASIELAADSATFFVQKPFSAASLRNKLQAALRP